MSKSKHIVVIGSGPGGYAAAFRAATNAAAKNGILGPISPNNPPIIGPRTNPIPNPAPI